jgi:hypothetical protein
VFAAEIAARGGYGEGSGTREKMKQGFFFDGVDIHGDHFPVYEAEEGAIDVLADRAYPSLAFLYNTGMGAKMTSHNAFFQFFKFHSLFHKQIIADLPAYRRPPGKGGAAGQIH